MVCHEITNITHAQISISLSRIHKNAGVFFFQFYVHINVELFIHVFIHLFNRADGFKRVFDCISVMRDVSRASHELRRSESKKAKLEKLSNNISERRGS